jgi:hypothetical protein
MQEKSHNYTWCLYTVIIQGLGVRWKPQLKYTKDVIMCGLVRATTCLKGHNAMNVKQWWTDRGRRKSSPLWLYPSKISPEATHNADWGTKIKPTFMLWLNCYNNWIHLSNCLWSFSSFFWAGGRGCLLVLVLGDMWLNLRVAGVQNMLENSI